MNSQQILQVWLQNPELAEPVRSFGLFAVAAVVGMASAAYGAYTSYQGQRKAKKAENERRAIQERQERVNRMREERNLTRQLQTGHAYALTQGGARGTLGSSSYYGTMNELAGTTAYDTSSISGNFGRAMELRANNDSMAKARGQISMGNSMTSMGMAIMQSAGTIAKVGSRIGALGSSGWKTTVTRAPTTYKN